MVDRPSPEAPFQPPPMFDGFAVEKPLGRGGMGAVYLGRDTDLDRSVALKFVAAREGSTTALERFRREARAIARLSHPNVVSIFRIGEVGGQPYIAYELVSGKSLDRTASPLPWQIVLRVGVGMARGLEAVHRAGVLHRDLKPANVVLSETGDVKLIDFGLASLASGDEPDIEPESGQPRKPSPTARTIDDLRLTQKGSVLGTPAYIAPEIWCGDPATSRSDVFALGMTLYELLTGDLPHHGLGFEELSRFLLLRDMPPLRERRPDVPESFASVVERCLRRDPEERFKSGAEVRELLETAERIFLPAGVGVTLEALALDPNHVAVASSFTRVKAKSESFTQTIYDRLFARAPFLRELFPSDMSGQQKKLLHMIGVAIDALKSPESLDAMLADLGRRHVHYGATAEHFTPLWGALLEALELHEGPAWTPELAGAWRHALSLLETRMRRGMDLEKPTMASSPENVLRVPPPIFGQPSSTPPPGSHGKRRTSYARSGDLDIAYQVSGEGPIDLVLLMGWLSHVELNWSYGPLMTFLQRLGRGARVVTYDRRGTGLSGRGHDPGSIDDHVDDLRFVCQAAGLRQPVLFGIADGAPTAVLAAALHPDEYSGLVLYGATPRTMRADDFASGHSEEEIWWFERAIQAHWGEPLFLEERAPSMAKDPELRDWMALYMRMAASPNQACALLRDAASLDVRAALPHVDLPTLVVHRSGDRTVPLASGRYLAERLPNARFVELPGDDHLPYVGASDELVDVVHEHLATVFEATAALALSTSSSSAADAPAPAPAPVRFVAVFRDAGELASVAREIAPSLGGTPLGSEGGAVGYAFARGRAAVLFLDRLARAAARGGVDFSSALDAAPLARGAEASAVAAAARLLGSSSSPHRAPVSALARACLAGTSIPLEGEGDDLVVALASSASAA